MKKVFYVHAKPAARIQRIFNTHRNISLAKT
jgi:hypothetical protein